MSARKKRLIRGLFPIARDAPFGGMLDGGDLIEV